MLLLIYKFFL